MKTFRQADIHIFMVASKPFQYWNSTCHWKPSIWKIRTPIFYSDQTMVKSTRIPITKIKTVSQPFYLYNGNPHTWKDGLHIEAMPWALAATVLVLADVWHNTLLLWSFLTGRRINVVTWFLPFELALKKNCSCLKISMSTFWLKLLAILWWKLLYCTRSWRKSWEMIQHKYTVLPVQKFLLWR